MVVQGIFFDASKQHFPSTSNEGNRIKQNSENATTTFLEWDHLRFIFCTKLAKMNISVAEIFVQRNFFQLQNNFALIPAMNVTQTNKIQEISYPLS